MHISHISPHSGRWKSDAMEEPRQMNRKSKGKSTLRRSQTQCSVNCQLSPIENVIRKIVCCCVFAVFGYAYSTHAQMLGNLINFTT